MSGGGGGGCEVGHVWGWKEKGFKISHVCERVLKIGHVCVWGGRVRLLGECWDGRTACNPTVSNVSGEGGVT